MTYSSHDVRPCYKDLPRFVLDHGAYDENNTVLIDATAPQRAITKVEAKEMVERTVRGLHAAGLRRGDTVCVVHLNDVLYPVVFLAIIMAGGRFSGANPSYTAGELRHHFQVSEAKFVISDLSSLPAVSEASENLVDAINIIIWDERQSGPEFSDRFSLATIMGGLPGALRYESPVFFEDEGEANETVAALMSTSGTTGLPKMAARSHLSWVTENLAIQDDTEKPYEVVRLLFTPFFHGFTAPLALVDALRSGHTTYIMPRFNLQQCLDYVERYNVTEIAAPPPVLLMFMRLPENERRALRSIRLVWSGGAPMSAETQNEALKMFHPEARIVQVYGMTEGGWMTTFKYPERDLSGSVGRFLPFYNAKILDESGADITNTHSPGLLYVKSPIIMLRYLNNPTATSETLTDDNWLCTGDIGYLSTSNKLHITDRQKDIIKVRGWQVSPTELESCLLSHPLVSDAGVFGYHDKRTNSEIPIAHITPLVDDFNPRIESELLQTIVKHCYATLAKYKVNDLEIRFKPSIPKNPAGKILRRQMRDSEDKTRILRYWLEDLEFGGWEEGEVVSEADRVSDPVSKGEDVLEELTGEKDEGDDKVIEEILGHLEI